MPNLDFTAIGIAAIGVGLPALLSLNIFATRADVAENYVSKQELKDQLESISDDVRELKQLVIKSLEKTK